ncbi:MAG: kelch repeat-containing protein [Planctomycetota bacterium]
MSFPRLAALPLIGAAAAAQIPNPNPIPMAAPRADWVLTSGVTGTPTQRRDNPGAASDDKMYVFGGRDQNAGTTVLNALYEFDGATWTLKTAEGAAGSPPARGGAAIAWDRTRNKLVVFGGDTGTSTPSLLGDTWEWDPTTNAWSNVTPPGSPQPRRWASMAYEPTSGGMLLFGGEDAITTPISSPSSETWLYLGGAWTQLNPSNVPPARRLHSLATRLDFGDVFLCAGDDSSTTPITRMLDVWTWTAGNWQPLSTNGTIPHGTTANQAVYDPLRRRIVLQGGQGISVPNSNNGGQYGDLWGGSPSTWCSEFDCLSNRWITYGAPAFGTGHPVIGRISRYFAAFVPALGKIYKVSGQNPSGVGTITGTCEYQANPVAAAVSSGAGCFGVVMAPSTSSQLPWLGRTFTARVSGLSTTSLVVGVIGATSVSLPLSALHPAGRPGCNLLANLDVTLPVANLGGFADMALPLPNVPFFAGTTIYEHALQIELTFPTITAITSPNALALTLGVP